MLRLPLWVALLGRGTRSRGEAHRTHHPPCPPYFPAKDKEGHAHATTASDSRPRPRQLLTMLRLSRLRNALSASQAEVSRLRGNLRSQELLVERNGEELRSYREAMEQSQDKLRQGTANADRRQHELLDEFKRRYDRERSRLSTALERSQAISRRCAPLKSQPCSS